VIIYLALSERSTELYDAAKLTVPDLEQDLACTLPICADSLHHVDPAVHCHGAALHRALLVHGGGPANSTTTVRSLFTTTRSRTASVVTTAWRPRSADAAAFLAYSLRLLLAHPVVEYQLMM